MTLHNLDVGIALAVVMLGVSLLITILTQLIAAVLSTRGTTLRKNLQVLFETVYPDGAPHAKEIAYKVLTDKLISDSASWKWLSKIPLIRNFRLATAVRVEEVIGILDRLGSQPVAHPIQEVQHLAQRLIGAQPAPPAAQAGPPPAQPTPEWVQQAVQLAQSVQHLQQPPPVNNMSVAMGNLWRVVKARLGMGQAQQEDLTIGVMRTLVQRETQRMTPQVEAIKTMIEKVKGALADGPGPQGASGIQVQIAQLMQRVPAAAEVVLKGDSIKSWFNSAMDRASQQFALWMRVFTVACSILVAFSLHLDTFRFLNQVSTDPELRASLVNASQAMQSQAAAILQEPKPSSEKSAETARGISSIYIEALKKTAKENQEKVPALKTVLNEAAGQHFGSRDQAAAWLRAKLSGGTNAPDIVDKFQVNVDNILSSASRTDQLLDHAASIRSSIDSSGFKLLEEPYSSWDYFHPWPRNRHFWGILFSAGLLSLGAPFWFNALKSLSSLRPVVASREEKERLQAA